MERRLAIGHLKASGWCRLGGCTWLLLLLATTPSLHAATFKAALNTDTVTLGESASLSLTFEGGSPNEAPAPPSIPNLQITYLGPSSQFSYINGQVSSTVTHNYTITPRQIGDYTIPSLTADVGGVRLNTQPLKLKVVKPGTPPPEAINSGSQPAFLKLVLPKKEVYLGEIITGELQFYFRQGTRFGDQPRLTSFPVEGFQAGKMAEGQQRQLQVGNAVYNMMPVSVPLTAIKTGPLSVGPITANVVIELPSASRRRDLFDPFNMFGGGYEQKQITLATDTESVQSLPLPAANVPANFNGVVGNYSLSVTAGPTNVAVGDPVTVRVSISGRGALDALSLPAQSGWGDFKMYPPSSKTELADALGVQGARTFEQIVVPQNTDIHALPAFTFSFFDPDQKIYRALTQPAMQLVVRPGGAAQAPVVVVPQSAAETPTAQRDIVPIKQRLGPVTAMTQPLAVQPWFLATQSVPVLAWFAAFAWRRRNDALANNPRLRRQRQVARIIRDGLADLRRLAAENNSANFFATLFRLLQEQLGERLDCPASSITEAIVDEKLQSGGVPDSLIGALRELFQACNLARYAPVQSSQELAALCAKCESALRELQGLKL